MQGSPKNIYNPLITILFISALFGFMIGSVSWCLVVGFAFWAWRQIRELNKLNKWLTQSEQTPPEANGYWGNIFDELAKLQKRQRGRVKDLKEIIIRFQQSSSALPDAVVIIDRFDNLDWWNRSADQLLGLKASSDRGKPVMNLLRDPRFIRYYRKNRYDETIQLPSPVKTGSILQYQITSFGEGNRLLVARDITQLVRLEQTRQDFVANASHELRTPLTVIRGYLETFIDQDLSRPMQRAFNQMQNQAARMESLVEDLLLLSRLESSQHVPDEKPVGMPSLLGSIKENAEALSGEKQHQITLDVDSEFDLLGQYKELHSAFSNLAYNAVRYTPESGLIKIRWWVDQDGGHFSVEDNGIGIESIHLDRLTERFYRVDEGRSTATGGTGLGLAIVKHSLQRHGAHLEVKSQVGKGSCFICHFPSDLIVSA